MADLTSKEIITMLEFSEVHFGPSGIYVHDEESEYLAIGPRGEGDYPVSEEVADRGRKLANSFARTFVEFDPAREDPWIGGTSPAFIFLAAG